MDRGALHPWIHASRYPRDPTDPSAATRPSSIECRRVRRKNRGPPAPRPGADRPPGPGAGPTRDHGADRRVRWNGIAIRVPRERKVRRLPGCTNGIAGAGRLALARDPREDPTGCGGAPSPRDVDSRALSSPRPRLLADLEATMGPPAMPGLDSRGYRLDRDEVRSKLRLGDDEVAEFFCRLEGCTEMLPEPPPAFALPRDPLQLLRGRVSVLDTRI